LEFNAVETVSGILSEQLEFSIEVVQGHDMKALCVRARIIIWSAGQCEERKSSNEYKPEVYNYALFPLM
jgi:hypothetical protein